MKEPDLTLNNSIDELKECQKKMKEAAKESPDVRDGKCTLEDELSEPGYVLYNQITESTIGILQLPEVVKTFEKFSEQFGAETSKAMVELLSIIMTQSAYNAVVFYDELLKKELTKQFDNVGEHLNATRSIVEAHTGALSVFKKQLNDTQNKLKIDEFTKKNGISTPE